MDAEINALLEALLQVDEGAGQSWNAGGQSWNAGGQSWNAAPAIHPSINANKKGANPMWQQGPQKKFAMEGVGGGPKAMGSVGGKTAEVRYEDPQNAQKALKLNGSKMGGCVVSVEFDQDSKDGSKIIVKNVPQEAEWQDLKDHFGKCGQVAFANIKGGGKGNTGPAVGTIRYATAAEAEAAVIMLNGSQLADSILEVKLHPGSTDNTKLQVFGLLGSTEWQDLKDHFAQVGTVVFADIAQGGGGKVIGEVRYENPEHTQLAIALLNGSTVGGQVIEIKQDMTSQDGTKLFVTGLPVGLEWPELKDHFSCVGTVAFCDVKEVGAKGKGFGKGMKGGGGNQQLQKALVGLMANQNGSKGMSTGGQMAGDMTTGTVRFENPLHTQFAIQLLNGTDLNGGTLQVDFDNSWEDGSKLIVNGLAPGTRWQELKDHFGTIGTVAFCNVGPDIKGKGKGQGKKVF